MSNLNTPIFFPSISSVKTNESIVSYIEILNALKNLTPQFLVSAYDLSHQTAEEQEKSLTLLSETIKSGTILLMDSGNYESYWKSDQANWKAQEFHRIMNLVKPQYAFSFDNQNPPESQDEHISILLNAYEIDCKSSEHTHIIPIIHGNSDSIPKVCGAFAKESGVDFIAVAERNLGPGILDRISTIVKIRKALDGVRSDIKLHLLGTGNPTSIAVYSLVGANSFDGLEWCQTVVNYDNASLYHFSQADFFKKQSSWLNDDLPFSVRALAHNLEFYSHWMLELNESLRDNNFIEFLKKKVPNEIFQVLSENLKDF